MLDVMDFSLDNAFVKMPDGQLLRQRNGIPMGDPLSPGMTIITGAWMEDGWLQTIHDDDKDYFRARRFMDDIIMVYAKCDGWDASEFLRDFTESQCYQKPLTLEDGRDGVFLETAFWTQDNHFRYHLKNDNEGGQTKIWRYHRWHSHTPYLQKRGTLTACLRKIQHMASDPAALGRSALDKIAEFRRLGYPIGVLRKTCSFLAASQGIGTWITVRDALRVSPNGPKARSLATKVGWDAPGCYRCRGNPGGHGMTRPSGLCM